jgi:hypothetical protein
VTHESGGGLATLAHPPDRLLQGHNTVSASTSRGTEPKSWNVKEDKGFSRYVGRRKPLGLGGPTLAKEEKR